MKFNRIEDLDIDGKVVLTRVDLNVEVILRTEQSYLVFRGRVSGITEDGRVFFVLSIDIEIRDCDLKRDVFRSGGPGGQHQNKTESGVRYTHLPTGIAAESRSERSQHKNDANAMTLLKAKLVRMEEMKREAEYAKMYDEKGEISFGSQIRNYVLQPYQLVKDLRTDFESTNPGKVLDGDLDGFIDSYLRMKLAAGEAKK